MSVDFFRHDFDNGNAVSLSPSAALPKTRSRRSQEASRAAELVCQLFEEAVKPMLPDRLAFACFFREQDLYKMGGAGAYETLRCRAPCQLSSNVFVVTVSTCSPKRFI